MLNKYLYSKDGSERIHIVIKIDDLIKYVKAPVKLALLENDLEDIQAGRKSEGKDPIPDYLVINTDEPYAALVQNIILGKATTNDIPEVLTEKLLKEYAEDLFEEFQQVERFEGKITMKDVVDILQIEVES